MREENIRAYRLSTKIQDDFGNIVRFRFERYKIELIQEEKNRRRNKGSIELNTQVFYLFAKQFVDLYEAQRAFEERAADDFAHIPKEHHFEDGVSGGYKTLRKNQDINYY